MLCLRAARNGSFRTLANKLITKSFSSSGELWSATCTYRNGFAVLTIPLPSRGEDCEFILKPVTNTVKDLQDYIKAEDGGVDRAAIYTTDDVRISKSTPIEVVLAHDFKILLNNHSYDIVSPKLDILAAVKLEDQLSDVKNLITKLYVDIHGLEYKEQREQAIQSRIEQLKTELQPLEDTKAEIDQRASQSTNFLVWSGLGFMAFQFGFLARLTWWEYSWDIMEPVTYFITYGTSMAAYAYFVLTRQVSFFLVPQSTEF